MAEKEANAMTEKEAAQAIAKLLGISPDAVSCTWDSTGGGLDGTRTIEMRIDDTLTIRVKDYAYQNCVKRIAKLRFGDSAETIAAIQKKLLELNDELDSLHFDADDRKEESEPPEIPEDRAPQTEKEADLRLLDKKLYELKHEDTETMSCTCDFCSTIERLRRSVLYEISIEQKREAAENPEEGK